MNPKPFSLLNHFTMPCAISYLLLTSRGIPTIGPVSIHPPCHVRGPACHLGTPVMGGLRGVAPRRHGGTFLARYPIATYEKIAPGVRSARSGKSLTRTARSFGES